MRDSVLVTSIRAMPMTVRIASTRIAITSAAPLWLGSFISVVAQVDAKRLDAAAVVGVRADRRVHQRDDPCGRRLVSRVGVVGSGDQRDHDAVQPWTAIDR